LVEARHENMSKQTGWIWLAMAWLLLGVALLLVSGLEARSRAEAQVEKIVVDPVDLTVSEPSGTAIFTLTLTSEPTATVFISMSTSNNECAVSPAFVDLDDTNWATGVTATVTAVDDAIVDGTQNCRVVTEKSHSDDPRFDSLTVRDVKVTVHDDDVAGLVVSPTSLTISEPDGSGTFTLTLTSAPTATVSVPLSSTVSQCTVTPATADLDDTNWATGITATVTAVDDAIADGTQTCWVQAGPSTSADPGYAGLEPVTVTVTVYDDDTVFWVYLPSIQLNWPPLPGIPVLNPIHNADGDGTYSISWSPAPRAETYILEEGKDSILSDASEIYSGTSSSYVITQRGATRYYYRVKASGAWGDSGWSSVQWVDVLWEAEPNDRALTQSHGPIVSGLTYYGTFTGTIDLQDYFYFNLSTPRPVELWLTHVPVGQNFDLVLRNASLDLIGYSGELANADEHILAGILPPGRYYIQVYHRSSGGSHQPYHLKVVYE
jgi:hypothetical protein